MCDFVSGIAFVAKTHAITCGKTKQQARKRPRAHKCTECEEIFSTKVSLDHHFKMSHVTSTYLCSHCGKVCGTRNKYMNHLRIHDEKYISKFKCDVCDFKAKSNWHLKRHRSLHFQNAKSLRLCAPLATASYMQFEVSLTELYVDGFCNGVYEMNLLPKFKDHVVEKEASDKINLEEFYESFEKFGMSDEDWSDWVSVSNMLQLSPYEGIVSWVGYKKDDTECFRICF